MSNNENYCWLMWRNGLDMDSLVETVERGHWANGRKRENGWKEEAKRGKDEIAVFGRGGPQAPPTFIDFHLFYFIFLYYFFFVCPAGKCSSAVWVGKRAPRDCGNISASSVTSPKWWSWRIPPRAVRGMQIDLFINDFVTLWGFFSTILILDFKN